VKNHWYSFMRRNVRRLNREVNEAPSSFAARSDKRGAAGGSGADSAAGDGGGDSGEDGAYTVGESEASRKKRGMRKAANLAELNRYYTAATEAAQVRCCCCYYCCLQYGGSATLADSACTLRC
jgi:hypothetical protein